VIVCFGSLNHDLVLPLARLPLPGETLAARALAGARGGKGHNQATAAARLGGSVAMVGAVGRDDAGAALRGGLAADGVATDHVVTVDGPTGTAVCLVADDGANAIVIVAGANGTVSAALAESAAPELGAAELLLLQGEVPVDASVRAAELARAGGGRVVLNPAPVPDGVERLLVVADVVVANEGEAAALGLRPDVDVVVTLGGDGVRVRGRDLPAYPATVRDPTGAGDAFVGGLAVALSEGADLVDACRFGAAAGACAVEVVGAEPSFPSRAAAEARLAGGPPAGH